MNCLECKNISKSFGQVRALNKVSVTAYGGEILALLGGNGSGKSTISKIIGGLYRKDEGSISLNGREINVNSPREAKKERIVVTSQELSLMDNFTVAENICMGKLPKRGIWIDKNKIREMAEEVLAQCGLQGYGNRAVDSLKENEKYLVEFAKAIISEPAVLILDEITSALYKEDVETLYGVLRKLKEKGVITIFISHRMNEIFQMSDKVTVLRNGEFIDTYETDKVSENELLFAMTGQKLGEAVKEKKEPVLQEDGDVLLSVKNHVLKGFHKPLSLELHRGEVIGVAGLQGQGQSQLVRELFAMERSVQLSLNGTELTLKNASDAVKHKLAFVSGNRTKEGSFPNRSIEENLSVVSDLIWKNRHLDREHAIEKYKVRMGKFADSISTLSGGNQQKIILARWTATNPDVMLLDDPTKGIDVGARMDVHKIIARLADEGTGVIFASSDEEELINLARYCKRYKIIVMYGGQVRGILSGEEISKDRIYTHAIPKKEDEE